MILQTQGLKTLALVRTFVAGNEPVAYTLTDRTAAYGWIADTLKQHSFNSSINPEFQPPNHSPRSTSLMVRPNGQIITR